MTAFAGVTLMSSANFGVVFGPTLLRPEVESANQFAEIKYQNAVGASPRRVGKGCVDHAAAVTPLGAAMTYSCMRGVAPVEFLIDDYDALFAAPAGAGSRRGEALSPTLLDSLDVADGADGTPTDELLLASSPPPVGRPPDSLLAASRARLRSHPASPEPQQQQQQQQQPQQPPTPVRSHVPNPPPVFDTWWGMLFLCGALGLPGRDRAPNRRCRRHPPTAGPGPWPSPRGR